MNIEELNSAYFLGIGGIGMSALAMHLQKLGVTVSGFDRTATDITDQLMALGMDIHFEEDISRLSKSAELVVYTPAIPDNNIELSYYRENGYLVKKRSEVLEEVTKNRFTIAIAGSHGKTTVSAMIAHILKVTGYDCTAFLGGVATNYNTNYLHSNSNTVVVEADEFDRSFLKLQPSIEVITAIDADHLDVYQTEEALQDAFLEFTKNLSSDGNIIAHIDLPNIDSISGEQMQTYSLTKSEADYSVAQLSLADGSYHFDVATGAEILPGFILKTGAKHNVENALGAIAVARLLGVDAKEIARSLASFEGVKRRFESILNTGDTIYIDDYAHHPKEIESLINSVRDLFPKKVITAVFQPHLYSRTQAHSDAFAQSLDLADRVILLDIYPAREQPIKGVNAELILGKMKNGNKKHCPSNEALFDELSNSDIELLLTVGAGDIDQLVEPIKNLLINKKK